jgi:hypothetical protein
MAVLSTNGKKIMTALESIIIKIKQVVRLLQKTKPGNGGTDPSLFPFTTIQVDDRFNQDQRQEINAAMQVIFNLFGGAGRFYELTGIPNLKFVSPAQLSCKQSNAIACYLGDGVIEMTASAFNPAPLVPGWFVAHEVGHAFDFSRSRGKPRAYRSQAFVENFVPKNWLQRLFGLPICRVVSNIGYQGGVWTEIARASGASIRGQLNSAEDFAETFAVIYALAVLHRTLPYRSFNSPWRYDRVVEMIRGKI